MWESQTEKRVWLFNSSAVRHTCNTVRLSSQDQLCICSRDDREGNALVGICEIILCLTWRPNVRCWAAGSQRFTWTTKDHSCRHATCLYHLLFLLLSLYLLFAFSLSMLFPQLATTQMQKQKGDAPNKTHTITLIVTQTTQFPPTQRVTRPPTEGSELPSHMLALPRSICHNTWARGGGEGGDTTEEEWGFKIILFHRAWIIILNFCWTISDRNV